MKKILLLFVAMLAIAQGASAQQKVRKMFNVSDAGFTTTYWDKNEERPNSSNPVNNSFYIGDQYGAVAWQFVDNWWDDSGLDMSGYDRLVIRVKSCVGNNVQFRIFSHGSDGQLEYDSPDDIVESDEEIEYEIPLEDGLEDNNGKGALELNKVHYFVFWNYWDVNASKATDDTRADYDPTWTDPNPGSDVTVTLSAFYLERTLANGEKDYVDLLADNKFSFTDEGMGDDGGNPSYIDNTGSIHLAENAEGGFFFDDEPADWSLYKYIVVVPQKPYEDGNQVIRYVLTDTDENAFDGGTLRYGFYNRARAAVQDLTAITSTDMDDNVRLDNFDPSAITSLKFSLWGGVAAVDWGLAAVWLTNTPPTYSTAFGDGTDNTGDYVIQNSSANTVMTVCLPFASAVCGAQVYTVAGVDDPANPSEIYAAPYYGILEAGKPYIIRTNSERNVTFFEAGVNEVAAPVANGALVADQFTTYYVEGGKNYLVLNEDGDTFEAVAADDDIRVNSHTAYIDCSKLGQAEEQDHGLVFSVSGAEPFTPTGISNIKGDNNVKTANGAVYDLSGRRVSKPVKGLYIKDGKKFVVK